MSIDTETARRVAKLARIKVDDDALPALASEFSAILGFIEQLNEVDVEGVEPEQLSGDFQRLLDGSAVVVDLCRHPLPSPSAHDARFCDWRCDPDHFDHLAVP